MIKAVYIKKGDTETTWQVNVGLVGATVKSFVRNESGVEQELPAAIADAPKGLVTVTTSTLAEGKYSLSVRVSQGGKVSTFPGERYAVLVVGDALGDS
jgi:hypothetical protein